MSTYEIDAWLGDAEATDEQREALVRAAERIDELWPEEDLADTREQALIGAAQIILGDATLEEVGREHDMAKRAADEARERLAGAVIASEGTDSEVRLAERAGVQRLTIRRWLGK